MPILLMLIGHAEQRHMSTICRQLVGSLLCLLAGLRKLNAARPILLCDDKSREENNLQPTIKKMWLFAILLVKLDSLPPMAALGLQQQLAFVLWQTWLASQVSGLGGCSCYS